VAYTKTLWKDRLVEKPLTFNVQNNPDGTITLMPAEGQVIEAGTPIIANNMNNIEQGIENAHTQIDAHKAEYTKYHGTAGTANALTVSIGTGLTFDLTKDGNLLHINPSLTNTGATTINPDGQGAKAIKKFDIDTDSYIDLEEGDIKKSHPLTLRWDLTNGFFVLAPRGGGVKSIQQINYAMDAADKEINISINPVNLNKAVVIADIQYSVPSTGTPGLGDFCQIKIISPTTVRLKKYGGGSKVEGTFYVVEFDGLKSLQVIEQSLNISQTYSNISIAAINPSKSLLFFTYSFGISGGYQEGVTHGKILNANTLAFRNRYLSSGVTEHLVCYVAEFK